MLRTPYRVTAVGFALKQVVCGAPSCCVCFIVSVNGHVTHRHGPSAQIQHVFPVHLVCLRMFLLSSHVQPAHPII